MKHLNIILPMLLWAFTVTSCRNKGETKSTSGLHLPQKENFEHEIDGKQVGLYFLKGNDHFTVALTNYGARVVGIYLPDNNGDLTNVVLGLIHCRIISIRLIPISDPL